MKLLILGGTGEASALARALADDPRFSAVLSLAGRTRHPAPQPLPTRRGGFGGAAGLARYLAAERIAALIDATHPFAVEISRNAVEAARATATPLLTILRPQWEPAPGDCWLPVPDMPAAAAALGNAPRRVLLTIGRQDLAPFAAAPWHHYIVRSVDPPPPEELPPAAEIIAMRGPFLAADERRLLAGRGIQILVTKNSGGSATVGKLHAARALGIPVVMVARPPKPASETRATVVEALAWLARRHAASLPRGA